MIRHHEEVGLLPSAQRTESGYRQYGGSDIQTLRFIRHSRDLGFSIPEIGRFVSLWHDLSRPSSEVKALAKEHIKELEAKAHGLLAMKWALEHLVHCCRGVDRPDCPIVDTLAAAGAPVASRSNGVPAGRRARHDFSGQSDPKTLQVRRPVGRKSH